jgi:methionyl-tRNA synthetase
LNEIISFVESGLKDLSISRATVTWGIPFPGDDRHVIYVWADALNNYITGIGYGDPAKKKEFDFWWPADMQVLGKDIARFHAIYWPAFLMATGLPLPRRLLVHGWIKIGDQKMSKSLGNIVDPQELARIYGIDPVRYYLVRYMAVTQDSPFSIEDLEQRITSDLANDLGNLVNRMLTLALKHDLIKVEAPLAWNIQEQELQYKLQQLVRLMKQDIYDGLFHRAYAHLGIFVSLVNSYFHAREPWRVVKQSKEDFNQIISAVCHSLYGIALLLWPVMPQKMHSLLEALGAKLIFGDNVIDSIEHDVWKRTFSLTQIPPLFVKPEHRGIAPVPQAEETVDDKEITINDFNKMELRVGTIDAVDEIPKSEKLFKLTVNFGEQGIRTICSGIKQRIAKEELLNKQLVFVFNLQPRMLMGIASHGMLLTAENDDKTLRIITVSGPVANGTRLK